VSRALPWLLVALLAACSPPPAQPQTSSTAATTTSTTYKIDNRTFQCETSTSGTLQTSRCSEMNGPYISLCVGTLVEGGLRQNCTDNYGNAWDPNQTVAPPLPPASQVPKFSAPTPPERPR